MIFASPSQFTVKNATKDIKSEKKAKIKSKKIKKKKTVLIPYIPTVFIKLRE